MNQKYLVIDQEILDDCSSICELVSLTQTLDGDPLLMRWLVDEVFWHDDHFETLDRVIELYLNQISSSRLYVSALAQKRRKIDEAIRNTYSYLLEKLTPKEIQEDVAEEMRHRYVLCLGAICVFQQRGFRDKTIDIGARVRDLTPLD